MRCPPYKHVVVFHDDKPANLVEPELCKCFLTLSVHGGYERALYVLLYILSWCQYGLTDGGHGESQRGEEWMQSRCLFHANYRMMQTQW